MKPYIKSIFVLYVGMFVFCQRGYANLVFSRNNVTFMTIEGYDEFKNKKSFFDVGTLGRPAEDGSLECEIKTPRKESPVSQKPWAPFDFYTNVLTKEEQSENSNRLGAADVFFIGDNFNRNGKADPANWTLLPMTKLVSSLDFLNKIVKKDYFQFHLRFTRGALFYENLVRAKSFYELDEKGKPACTSALYLCSDPKKDAQGISCDEDAWGLELKQLIAHVDLAGASKELFLSQFGYDNPAKKRNDLSKLEGKVIKVDEAGTALSEAYTLVLSQK